MTDVPDHLTAALADRNAIERELGSGGTATASPTPSDAPARSIAMRPPTRRCHPLVVGVVVGLVLGCGPRDEPSAESRTALTILANPSGMHPRADMDAKLLMYLPLVTWDTTGQPLPRLAQRWEHSGDHREWTVHLRRDVAWHDGVPVTARDIEFTVALWNNPDIGYWASGQVESVAVLDDHTIRLMYARPQLPNPWRVYWPRHVVEPLDPSGFWDWEFWEKPVGNGPFRFVRRVPGQLLELEANPDFYAGKPKIDRLILRGGGSEPVIELLSGSVDMAFLDPKDVAKLGGDARFTVYPYVAPRSAVVLYWNHRHELFRDAVVRRALTMAIDRRGLQAVLGYPRTTPIIDWPFTRGQLARRELPDPLPHDASTAARLLEAAGWRDDDGDGVRERGGREFAFNAMITEEYLTPATFVQAQLRQVGVRMDVQTMLPQLVSPNIAAGEFEAAIFHFSNIMQGWMGQDSVFGSRSHIGYRNPEVLRLLQEAQHTVSPSESDRIYRELMAVFRDDVPVTFLTIRVRSIVAHRRVRGVRTWFGISPMELIEQLWIEEDGAD